jgi:hypothetical protein
MIVPLAFVGAGTALVGTPPVGVPVALEPPRHAARSSMLALAMAATARVKMDLRTIDNAPRSACDRQPSGIDMPAGA